MTIEQFENYSFSINTEIKYNGEWMKVMEVDFEKNKIGIMSGQILDIDEIEDIREDRDKDLDDYCYTP